MCGRFGDFLEPEALGKLYKADIRQIADWVPHYNIAPSMNAPVLFGDNGREFQFARFGMKPSWWNHPGRDFINVRAETIREKPFFQRELKERRCVLPAFYYEWKRAPRGRVPYVFLPRGGGLFSLACIWEVDKIQGHDRVCFSIVTAAANALMRPVHDRMPVSLEGREVEAWLDPDSKVDALLRLLKPPSPGGMVSHMVSRDVNSPSHDGKYLIETVL